MKTNSFLPNGHVVTSMVDFVSTANYLKPKIIHKHRKRHELLI